MPASREGERPRETRRVTVSGEERISTIHAGQGAKVTTRKNAAEAATHARRNAEARYLRRHPEARRASGGPKRSGRNVVIVVLCAIVVLAVVFFVGSCVSAMFSDSPTEQVETEDQGTQSSQEGTDDTAADSAQEEAPADGSVSYQGSTYVLAEQESGRAGLVRTDASGAESVLFEIEGTPAAIVRLGSTIAIPESRDDGTWDVVCYVVGGHSDATYVVGSDGAMVQGSGAISSVELDGTTLRVTDDSGATTDVALE